MISDPFGSHIGDVRLAADAARLTSAAAMSMSNLSEFL
jgi:hypothetical protein